MRKNERIDNPVSREIVLGRGYKYLYNYFPKIALSGDDQFEGYAVSAILPKEPYQKWIAYVTGLERLRERVKQKIEEIFSLHVFNVQSYLVIKWSAESVAFDTDGTGCGVYVSNTPDFGYYAHNVDSYEQAIVLYIALSVYLPEMHFALEQFASGSMSTEKCVLLTEEISQEIRLNKQKGCDMQSTEECIHFKTYVCTYCSRNPESFIVKSQEDLARLGDKWEPPGGIPGKNLCISCAANIAKPVCPNCGYDNSDYFQ